jgi:hypothetical protein
MITNSESDTMWKFCGIILAFAWAKSRKPTETSLGSSESQPSATHTVSTAGFEVLTAAVVT